MQSNSTKVLVAGDSLSVPAAWHSPRSAWRDASESPCAPLVFHIQDHTFLHHMAVG